MHVVRGGGGDRVCIVRGGGVVSSYWYEEKHEQ